MRDRYTQSYSRGTFNSHEKGSQEARNYSTCWWVVIYNVIWFKLTFQNIEGQQTQYRILQLAVTMQYQQPTCQLRSPPREWRLPATRKNVTTLFDVCTVCTVLYLLESFLKYIVIQFHELWEDCRLLSIFHATLFCYLLSLQRLQERSWRVFVILERWPYFTSS